ncbi:MAG: hypothetical protein ACREP2_09145 [Rhodanobacteraceae bacterium]
MNYLKALRARRLALLECKLARRELQASVDEVIVVYEAHPVPVLAGAAGLGFVLAQFRMGSGLMRMGVRIATGPAWQLVRQFVDRLE